MNQKLRLNLGSDLYKRDGYINVDKYDYGGPDLLMDLERTPWQFEDCSVCQIVLNHTLEHLGRDVEVFFAIMKEIYRVCENDARTEINVPHPKHKDFMNDPTHVRVITPDLLNLFCKKRCLEWKKIGAGNSPLALYLDVDFEVITSDVTVEKNYLEQLKSGALSESRLYEMIDTYNNVAKEYRTVMKPVKS